jgi:chromosome segregation ATPase
MPRKKKEEKSVTIEKKTGEETLALISLENELAQEKLKTTDLENEKAELERKLAEMTASRDTVQRNNNEARNKIKRLEGEVAQVAPLKQQVQDLSEKVKNSSGGPIDVEKVSKFPGFIKGRDDHISRFDSDKIGRA